ncbi:MAG: anaphase-promoting complex subunit 3 [Verrucomicrobiota bacterium]|jgi:tetratricopeptide (TPR) repeat protein
MRSALAALQGVGKRFSISNLEFAARSHTTAPMKFPRPRRSFLFTALTMTAFTIANASAEDPSIDKLLKKLPPPEKIITSQVDPAMKDPMVQQINNAAKAYNFGQALDLSRKLAQRYPRSAGAQALHGLLSLALRRYDEATDSFRKSVAVQPNFAFGYFGIGFIEFMRGRFAAALPQFRKSVQLAPNAGINLTFMSACADKLGHKQESLDYARRGAAASPSEAVTWFQLAHAESVLGHKKEAAAALKRGQQLNTKNQKRR